MAREGERGACVTVTDRILVFGSGRLATAIDGYFPNVTILDRSVCDVTDRDQVQTALSRSKYSVAINTAAVTSPGLCESDPGLAWRVNVFGARNVAVMCRKAGVRSVHISSNWSVDPVNEYGSTKYTSEHVGFDLILRTCYYDEGYWLLSSLGRGDRISLTDIDVFNPISITGFLQVFEKLLTRQQQGIVNIGVVERVSHYDFGVLLARAFGFPTSQIEPVQVVNTTYDYPLNTYLEPHPLSRISIVEDVREFRGTLDYDVVSMDPREPVQDLRGRSGGNTRLR